MQSISLPEQHTEQMRALTQQYIQNFDQFMDESYHQVNEAIDFPNQKANVSRAKMASQTVSSKLK
ncbi:unnamed protein product [Paramecium pentaurelia]|uniref:Uncharacterized protein n=1 Tax=Paramecium pentaurelia TaxID=43138 RepID=A0A8S1SB62_9CILI|nr:unnamed protein product [Paramecium pentaurelia]